MKQRAHYYAIGLELIDLLHLKVKQNGRVDTSGGDKTPEGLGRTVARVIEEGRS